MHTHQFFTWNLDNTHCREHNSTRLPKLYTYMCNIVTEFYLYSIVYIYLINSRLDVTYSVRHHFRIANFINLPTRQQDINRVKHTRGANFTKLHRETSTTNSFVGLHT